MDRSAICQPHGLASSKVQVLPSSSGAAQRPPGGGRGLLSQPYVPPPRPSHSTESSLHETSPPRFSHKVREQESGTLLERLRAMGDHIARPDSQDPRGRPGVPAKSWTKVATSTRQQSVRAVIPTPLPDDEVPVENLRQKSAGMEGAAAEVSFQDARWQERGRERPASALVESRAVDTYHRKGRAGKTTLLQRQMDEERRLRRQKMEEEERKKEALRALLQTIKERQSNERERLHARAASRGAAPASDEMGESAVSSQRRSDDHVGHANAETLSANRPSQASSQPSFQSRSLHSAPRRRRGASSRRASAQSWGPPRR